jgi:hypothetical protein
MAVEETHLSKLGQQMPGKQVLVLVLVLWDVEFKVLGWWASQEAAPTGGELQWLPS